MDKQDLIKAINEFFSDTSRTPEQARMDLEEVIEHAEMLVDSISSDGMVG